jgi:hypothetical protein
MFVSEVRVSKLNGIFLKFGQTGRGYTIPSSAEVWLLYLIEITCHTSALMRKRTYIVFGGDLEVISQSNEAAGTINTSNTS